jgi:hypothetical protein
MSSSFWKLSFWRVPDIRNDFETIAHPQHLIYSHIDAAQILVGPSFGLRKRAYRESTWFGSQETVPREKGCQYYAVRYAFSLQFKAGSSSSWKDTKAEFRVEDRLATSIGGN